MLPIIGCRTGSERQAGSELPVAVARLAFECLPAGGEAGDLQWLALGAAVHGDYAAVRAFDDAPVAQARDRIYRQLPQMAPNGRVARIAQQILQGGRRRPLADRGRSAVAVEGSPEIFSDMQQRLLGRMPLHLRSGLQAHCGGHPGDGNQHQQSDIAVAPTLRASLHPAAWHHSWPRGRPSRVRPTEPLRTSNTCPSKPSPGAWMTQPSLRPVIGSIGRARR